MEFWDDLSRKFGDAASAVGRGAEKLTDIAKLKYNISVRRGKLEKTFEAIGALRYEEIKNCADNAESVDALIADVDALNAEIAELSARLDERTGAVRCAKCGAKIASGAAFCPSCGEKVNPEE